MQHHKFGVLPAHETVIFFTSKFLWSMNAGQNRYSSKWAQLLIWDDKTEEKNDQLLMLLPSWKWLTPNPHRTRDAMRNAKQANGTCWCEWGCPHCGQATSKEKRSNLRLRRIPRPVWIGLKTEEVEVNCDLDHIVLYCEEGSWTCLKCTDLELQTLGVTYTQALPIREWSRCFEFWAASYCAGLFALWRQKKRRVYAYFCFSGFWKQKADRTVHARKASLKASSKKCPSLF